MRLERAICGLLVEDSMFQLELAPAVPTARGTRRRGLGLAVLLLLSAAPLAAGINRWTWLGLDGASVFALAVDSVDSRIVYAGTETGGVYKSEDGGASWLRASNGLSSAWVRALVVDPFEHATVYVALQQGVLKTTDGGASWNPSSQGLPVPTYPNGEVFSLIADPRAFGVLYAGTLHGVFRSLDGGASWHRRSVGLPAGQTILAVAIDPVHDWILYAGSNASGVYRSTNGGASWSATGSSAAGATSIAALAIDPHRPATLYAGTFTGTYKTEDRGRTWTRVLQSETEALVADPIVPGSVYAGTGRGVLRSTDFGLHWQVTGGNELGSSVVLTLAADPSSSGTLFAGTFLAGTLAGIFKTSDSAASWSFNSRGLHEVSVFAAAVDSQTPTTLYASINANELFKSTDRGLTWSALEIEHPAIFHQFYDLIVDPTDPATVYAVDRANGPLYKTADGGASWRLLDQDATGHTVHHLTALAVDPRAPGALYANGARAFYHSADRGLTWTSTGGQIPVAVLVSRLVVDPAAPAVVYALGAVNLSPDGPFLPVLEKTADGGATFSQAKLPASDVVGLAIAAGSPSTLYAVGRSGLFQSTDGAATWTLIALPQLPSASGPLRPQAVAVAPGNLLYVSAPPLGVLASRDGGATWTVLGRGLASSPFFSSIWVDPQDAYRLYLATLGLKTLVFVP